MMGWQWHQLDHMQIICTTLQTDNYASAPIYSTCTWKVQTIHSWKCRFLGLPKK